MKKKTARFLAAVLILAMLLGACGSAPENGTEGTADGSEGEGTRDTLIIGNYCEPTVLDPPNQNILSSGVVNVQIFDGLVRYNNETGEIEPSLATSWEQVDDYTLRLQLREGVVFHDGSPFTAEDVKFTFDRGAEGDAVAHTDDLHGVSQVTPRQFVYPVGNVVADGASLLALRNLAMQASLGLVYGFEHGIPFVHFMKKLLLFFHIPCSLICFSPAKIVQIESNAK